MDQPAFSADSHVIEDPAIWDGLLKDSFWGTLNAAALHERDGRVDATSRLEEGSLDGVGGEVLYPSLALRLFALEDVELQQQCFRRYNDWLAEFCQTAPDRLLGVPLLSTYDIDHAVKEFERCRTMGLRGAMVWQTPPAGLPFYGSHYDPLWAALSETGEPLSLHILTGFDYSRAYGSEQPKADDPRAAAIQAHRGSVNLKLLAVIDALQEVLFAGTFDRYPGLRLVLVENEIGWLPFVLSQWDYYVERFRDQRPVGLARKPSEYFGDQVFATFFQDTVGARLLTWWGHTGCMWSNDYPHGNSSWPHSQEWIAESLGHLPEDLRNRLIRGNAMRLYGLEAAA